MKLPIAAVLLFLSFASGCNQSGSSRAAHQTMSSPQLGSAVVDPAAFTGKWWRAASSDERQGFMAGFLDCYSDDLNHQDMFDQSWQKYEEAMNSRYADSNASSRFAGELLVTLASRPNGYIATSPHENEGNEWWRQDSAEARLGFLEGYISCHERASQKMRWSKPAAHYIARLNDAYNVDDQKGEEAKEYAGSIANAMKAMRDDGEGIFGPYL